MDSIDMEFCPHVREFDRKLGELLEAYGDHLLMMAPSGAGTFVVCASCDSMKHRVELDLV